VANNKYLLPREELIEELNQAISFAMTTSPPLTLLNIHGGYACGKTTLVRKWKRSASITPRPIAVYLDFKDIFRDTTLAMRPAEFLEKLSRSEEIQALGSDIPIFKNGDSTRSFDINFQKSLLDHLGQRSLVFVFDHFEKVVENPDRDFLSLIFSTWLKMADSGYSQGGRLVVVVIDRQQFNRRLKGDFWPTTLKTQLTESNITYFTGVGNNLRMTETEVKDFLECVNNTRYSNGVSVRWANTINTFHTIYQETGGHPWLVSDIGWRTYENHKIKIENSVNNQPVYLCLPRNVFYKAANDSSDFWTEYLAGYTLTPQAQKALKIIAQTCYVHDSPYAHCTQLPNNDTSEESLRELLDKNLIISRVRPNRYELVIPMLRFFFNHL
jgi:hypothetical protein